VVRQTEALFDEGVYVGLPVFAAAFARMQQHVLDNGIGASAVLDDLLEIVLQKGCHFVDLIADIIGETGGLQNIVELVGQVRR
jgi:hypothetical protein